MKRLLLGILAVFPALLWAAGPNLPESTNKLVNDFAGVFSAAQVAGMEARLEAFSDSTSNQICIVTILDLEGYAAADYAQRLGEKWGVGSAKSNGVLILLKPRTPDDPHSDVFIATGYGIEGALPDAVCSRIFRQEMVPLLKLDTPDYYGAVEAAINRIIPIMNGEYHEDMVYEDDDETEIATGLLIIALACIIIFLIAFFPTKKRRAKAALQNAQSPEDFAAKVPAALAAGLTAAWISQLEMDMPRKTLQAVRNSRTTSKVNHEARRARAFGNSKGDVDAAIAAAMAAIAAAALAARRANYRGGGSSGGSFSGGSGGGFGGFGGGHFGGGGAGGRV